MGLPVHLTPACWDSVWLELVSTLCVLSQLLCSNAQQSCCVQKTLLPLGHPQPLALIISLLLLLQWSLNLRRKKNIDVPFWTYNSSLLFSVLYLVGLCVSHYLLQWFFWFRLRDVLIILYYGYNGKSPEVYLILCPFSKVIVAESPLGPMTFLGPSSWPW